MPLRPRATLSNGSTGMHGRVGLMCGVGAMRGFQPSIRKRTMGEPCEIQP